MKKLMLILIVAVAAFTRLIFLDNFPNGFTGDEAQQGYSAYSILKTGKDEWGQVLPLFPRGFGDFKPPLYTYVAIPFIAVFDLNVLSTRLPSAMVGILTVLFIYLLGERLFGDKKIALLSSFLLAINPWHIQLSRTAFEGNLGIMLVTLALYFFLDFRFKNLVISMILFGLSLYSYHSFRLFIVMFVLSLIFFYREKIKFKDIIKISFVFLIFIIPIIFNIQSTLARASDVSILSDKTILSYFQSKLPSYLPVFVDRIFDNKILFMADKFVTNYLSYYSPNFLFSSTRPDNSYLNFPYYPLHYLLELFFVFIALYFVIRQAFQPELIKNPKVYKTLLLWLAIAPIPAALSIGMMNANRAITLMPLTVLLSAYGCFIFINYISKKINLNIYPYVIIILLLNLTFFLHFYFVKLPQRSIENLRFGYEQLFRKTVELSPKFDEIVFSKVFTEPQIFVAFYSKMDPANFQQASQDWLRYEKADKLYVDQLESWNLGKYKFEDLNWLNKESKRINALIISSPNDFPDEIIPIFEIKNPQGKVIYKAVSINR